MDWYNWHRPQEKLKGMTPLEFREAYLIKKLTFFNCPFYLVLDIAVISFVLQNKGFNLQLYLVAILG
ncbi:hypothetical protein PCN90_06575 [Streptococcus suis]|nr:IS3 family transposase [Streptococcus suis]MDN2969490.1 hypothetical protein [Streptococcus suis]MDN2977811.1 hypothetical protein [Streptococcus suis]